MPAKWDIYERLLGINNSDSGERTMAINDRCEMFESEIANDPSYQSDATVNGNPQPLAVTRKSDIEASFVTIDKRPLFVGDMVNCLDEDWIVASSYVDKLGFVKGVLWLCNGEIRYQNWSPEIITQKCVIDNGQYNKKSGDPDAYVMSNTYNMFLSQDVDSEKLYIDKRLCVGTIYNNDGQEILEVYKIFGIDKKSKNFGIRNHLIELKMQRDVYNAAVDNFDLKICNYIQESDDEIVLSNNGFCVIGGKDSIRIGTTRTYPAVFYNDNSEIINGVNAVWNINTEDDSITFEQDGNSIIINVPFSYDLIGKHITLELKDEESLYGKFIKTVEVIPIG